MSRKLLSIRRIAEIKSIEGADKIEAARVDGWWVVVKKGDFKVNDLVLYFEVDSWVPNAVAPFLTKEGKEPKVYEDVVGERLRSVKLRGQISQGLILPYTGEGQEGDDLSEQYGIKLWERPVPANMRGQVAGAFPWFIPRTDQERIQNIPEVLKDRSTKYEVTLKLDGSSTTVFMHEGCPGICSRNINLKLSANNNDNIFVKTARKTGLLQAVTCFFEATGRSIAVQGELMGPGVQGNREGFEDYRIYIFDIWDIDEQRYLSVIERRDVFWEFGNLTSKWFDHVPEIFYVDDKGVYSLDNLEVNSMDDALSLPEDLEPWFKFKKPIEGVVFKSLDGTKSFKIINNNFLLGEK